MLSKVARALQASVRHRLGNLRTRRGDDSGGAGKLSLETFEHKCEVIVHNSDVGPFFEDLDDIRMDGLKVVVLLFADLELAGKEFNLLSEMDEFLLESLSVSEGGFEVGGVLGSLGRFVTEEGLKFSDTLSKKSIVLFAFSELDLDALVFHDGYFVFLDLSTKGIDLLVLGVDGLR